MNLFWFQCIITVIVLSFDESESGVPRSGTKDLPENSFSTSTTEKTVRVRKHVAACKEYQRWRNRRIVIGGRSALPFEFPHVVALGFYNPNYANYQFDCGGSLISPTFVLTAAHCIYNPEMNDLKIIRVGTNEVPKNTNETDPEFDIEVKRVINHTEYGGTKKFNDISLVELVESVEHSPHYQPACLYSDDDDPPGLEVSGWGIIYFEGKRPTALQTVKVPSIPFKDCSQAILTRLNKTIESTHICAGNELFNTCEGDSGGPLHIKRNDTFYLVGITSYGSYCGTNVPGVYTRVNSYIDWIEKIVWP